MKRSRSKTTTTTIPVLGVTELAATLNGDDPVATVNCLRRFVTIVRRERRLALSRKADDGGDDDNESDASSSDDDGPRDGDDDNRDERPAAKKYKKTEAWKRDTAAYHVPFVGTSVARGQASAAAAVVVRGQWPTGLLRAYLSRSPRAVEFVDNNNALVDDGTTKHRKGGRRLDRSLRKHHLRALTELITAAIPPQRLMIPAEEDHRQSHPPPTTDPGDTVVAEVEDAWCGFVRDILQHHLTGLLRSLRDDDDTTTTTKGQNSALTAFTLRVLTRLVQTSTDTARRVVRALTASHPRVESTWRTLLRPRDDDGHHRRTRVAALQCVAALVTTEDAVVLTAVGTPPGVRDRRVPTGVWYLALREMSVVSDDSENGGTRAVEASRTAQAHVLAVTRRLLLRQRRQQTSPSSAVPKSVFSDLFTKEILQSTGKLVSRAPLLSGSNTFQSVLHQTDEYPDVTDRDDAIEARRLLFLLLDSSTGDRDATIGGFRLHESVVVRCLTQLVTGTGGLEVHRFVLNCLQANPDYMLPFLRTLALGNPNDGFAFLSNLNFLSKLMRHGPETILFRGTAPLEAENIGLQMFPLKKQTLIRAFQSPNGIIVSQSIYLVLSGLKRFSHLSSHAPTTGWMSSVEAFVMGQLPEITVLVKVLNRLHTQDEQRNSYLTGCLCELLVEITRILPTFVSAAKFDPGKILPQDAPSFAKLSPFARCKTLRAFRVITELRASSDSKTHIPQALRLILEVTVTTKNKRVFDEARKTAIALLELFLGSPAVEDNEQRQCLSFEVRCWTDGMTLEIIEEFCQKLQGSLVLPAGGMLELIRSWSDNGKGRVPQSLMSPLLIYFLKGSGSASAGLHALTLQVAGRCILFHGDPRGIASVVASCTGGNAGSRHLKSYAETILKPYDQSHIDPVAVLEKSVQSLFGAESILIKVLKGENVDLAKSDPNEMMRTFAHFAMVAGTESEKSHRFLALFRFCAILTISASSESSPQEHLRRATCHLFGDSRFIDTILLFCRKGKATCQGMTESDRFIEALSSSPTREERLQLAIGSFECAVLPLDVVSRRYASLALFLSSPIPRNTLGFANEAARDHAAIVTDQAGEITWEEDCLKSLWFSWCNIEIQKYREVAHAVHETLSCIMSHPSPAATALMNLMENMSPELVIGRVILFTAIKSASSENLKGTNFLEQLNKFDSSRYSEPLVSFVSQPEKSEQLLHDGVLDDMIMSLPNVATQALLSVLFKEVSSRLQEKRLIPGSVELLRFALANKEAALVSSKDDLGIHQYVGQICELDVASLNVNPISVLDVFDLFLEFHHQKSNDALDLSTTDIFLSVVRLTGQEIKRSKRSDPARLLTVMKKACDIVERVRNDIEASLLYSDHQVQNLVKRCLKMGVASLPSNDCELGVLSLRLLRLLVSVTADGADYARNKEISFPSLILDLLTTHSNFKNLMSGQDPAALGQRLGVAKLVLSCLLASRDGTLGKDELETLQTSCRASINHFDKIIRGILHLLDKSSEEGFYMDEVGWQDAPPSSRDTEKTQNLWDWLPSSIKQVRVFSTLRRFPSADLSLEIGPDKMHELASKDVRCANGDDRYSPGFLFQFFLASLESVMGISGDLVGSGGNKASLVDESKLDLAAVDFVQRMCDAGCLALTLAGLCSDHTMIRQLAISTLYLLTKTLHSESARRSSSWRERPQLCLLLDSVQRALAIQRSDPERHHGLETDSDLVKLPWVNPLAAVFLARASMVLMRPGDALYPAINRYFLRVQGEHGAFPDLNRPPAFMSLFCNSTEDPKVAEQERLWILEILRDSFLNERCWPPLKACHAPELLLSTISMRLGTDDHEDGRVNQHAREVELLLSILLRIQVFGGTRAKSYMLFRVGLLSWLGGVARGRPLRVFERNKGCAMLFLRLINESLMSFVAVRQERAETEQEEDSQVDAGVDCIAEALWGLPSVLCTLWNTAVSGFEVWNFSAEGLGSQSVSLLLTDLLVLLNQFPQMSESGALHPKLVNEILSKMVWKDDAHRVETLKALSLLPMILGDPTDELGLIETLLRLLARSDPHEDASARILRRISWLIVHQSDFPPSGELTVLLCRTRPLACRHKSTRAIWRSLYDGVVIADDGDDDDAMDVSSDS